MAKFFCFEKIVEMFYTRVFTEPKESYSKPTQLGVTFASGYLAGVVCAVVSHPADSLVSQLGKAGNKGKSLGAIAGEVGLVSLATKGLGTRVIMIGSSCPSFSVYYYEHMHLRYIDWIPMVDLRFIQERYGPGYYGWQVDITPSTPYSQVVSPLIQCRSCKPDRINRKMSCSGGRYSPFIMMLVLHFRLDA